MPKKKTESKPISPIQKARDGLKKSLGKNYEDSKVPLNDDLLREPIPHIPTGSVILDYLIGGRPNQFGVPPCPGWPRGRISNVYGNPGAGKTTAALEACASVIRMGETCAYIDFENEVDPSYAAAIGVPIADENHFILDQPDTLEEGFRLMWAYAKAGVSLIVIDSVGAGVPEQWFRAKDEEIGQQGRIGLLASKWSNFLPRFKRLITKSGTAVIAISQLRSKIGGMGMGPTTEVQGGKAWQYYSCVRMGLRVAGKERAKMFNPLLGKAEEQVTATNVIAKLDKCKVSSSVFHEMKYWLSHGSGIDDVRSIIEVGTNYNVISKKGAWYTWVTPEGEEIKACGYAGFRAQVDEKGLSDTLFSHISPLLTRQFGDGEVESEEDADPSILDGLEND